MFPKVARGATGCSVRYRGSLYLFSGGFSHGEFVVFVLVGLRGCDVVNFFGFPNVYNCLIVCCPLGLYLFSMFGYSVCSTVMGNLGDLVSSRMDLLAFSVFVAGLLVWMVLKHDELGIIGFGVVNLSVFVLLLFLSFDLFVVMV